MPKALLSTIALLLLATPGASELQVPAGWYAGDLHAHWRDSACYGVAPPEVLVQARAQGLGLGGGTITWNLRDTSGALVPKGVYFVRLRSADREENRPLVVAR